MRVVTALSLVLLAVGVNILAQSRPDTRLIFKNGTELAGKLIELKEGQYLVELPDGRRIQYSASDVEKLERIEPTVPVNKVATKTPCTKVLVTEATADPKYYTALKKVEVSKKFYNGADESYAELAGRGEGRSGIRCAWNVNTPSDPNPRPLLSGRQPDLVQEQRRFII